jgi:hypothetical protein
MYYQAGFTATPRKVLRNCLVKFSDNSSCVAPVTRAWDFGTPTTAGSGCTEVKWFPGPETRFSGFREFILLPNYRGKFRQEGFHPLPAPRDPTMATPASPPSGQSLDQVHRTIRGNGLTEQSYPDSSRHSAGLSPGSVGVGFFRILLQ